MSPVVKSQDNLSGVAKILTVVLVVCLGLWGCARKPATATGNNDRVGAMEKNLLKKEQEARALSQARDKARKELAVMEEENARLQKELSDKLAIVRERDRLRDQNQANLKAREELNRTLAQRTNERNDLRQQLVVRSNERDTLQNRCDHLRKGLQVLLTQDEAPAPTSPTPTSVSGGPSLTN